MSLSSFFPIDLVKSIKEFSWIIFVKSSLDSGDILLAQVWARASTLLFGESSSRDLLIYCKTRSNFAFLHVMLVWFYQDIYIHDSSRFYHHYHIPVLLVYDFDPWFSTPLSSAVIDYSSFLFLDKVSLPPDFYLLICKRVFLSIEFARSTFLLIVCIPVSWILAMLIRPFSWCHRLLLSWTPQMNFSTFLFFSCILNFFLKWGKDISWNWFKIQEVKWTIVSNTPILTLTTGLKGQETDISYVIVK